MGHRVAEVPSPRLVRHLLDRRFTQGPRTSLLRFAADQLDDPEHLVPQTRMPPAQQPGELFQSPLPPDPAMQENRDAGADNHRRRKDPGPHAPRRVEHAVEPEHHQI